MSIEVGGATEASGKDAESLSLAVASLELLEMGVADLGPTAADPFYGTPVFGLHEPVIGAEALHGGEATDLVDLKE